MVCQSPFLLLILGVIGTALLFAANTSVLTFALFLGAALSTLCYLTFASEVN